MEGLELLQVGWLSILPPVLAIALALITKEVYSSLLVGVASGMVIYSCAAGTGVLEGLFLVPRMMAEQISGQRVYDPIPGAFGRPGGGGHPGRGLPGLRGVGQPEDPFRGGGQALYRGAGVLIFIDDYFNCLTVGTVMGPVTDKFKVSRKSWRTLSTPPPRRCALSPPSPAGRWRWRARLAPRRMALTIFLQAIPYNLYAILTLLMVFFLCVTRFDFGPMRQAEREAQTNGYQETEAQDEIQGIQASSRGTVLDLVLPILVLIVCSVLGHGVRRRLF